MFLHNAGTGDIERENILLFAICYKNFSEHDCNKVLCSNGGQIKVSTEFRPNSRACVYDFRYLMVISPAGYFSGALHLMSILVHSLPLVEFCTTSIRKKRKTIKLNSVPAVNGWCGILKNSFLFGLHKVYNQLCHRRIYLFMYLFMYLSTRVKWLSRGYADRPGNEVDQSESAIFFACLNSLK